MDRKVSLLNTLMILVFCLAAPVSVNYMSQPNWYHAFQFGAIASIVLFIDARRRNKETALAMTAMCCYLFLLALAYSLES